ncbi:hypothetical protein [Geodermatophilus sp. URMC 63]
MTTNLNTLLTALSVRIDDHLGDELAQEGPQPVHPCLVLANMSEEDCRPRSAGEPV